MKYLTLIVFLGVFSYAFGVRTCYVCENEQCKGSELGNHKQDCRAKDSDETWLCESREDKNAGTIKKSCIRNNNANIDECDALNLDKKTSCLHCDRELCNNSATSLTSIIMISILASVFIRYL